MIEEEDRSRRRTSYPLDLDARCNPDFRRDLDAMPTTKALSQVMMRISMVTRCQRRAARVRMMRTRMRTNEKEEDDGETQTLAKENKKAMLDT